MKSLVIGLTVVCVLLLAGGAFVTWDSFECHLQSVFAYEQIEIFEEMREQALASERPSRIVEALQYIEDYYPTGTKQTRQSALDRLVEQQRAARVRDIIVHLRKVTGDDVGDEPRAWIMKYGTKERSPDEAVVR